MNLPDNLLRLQYRVRDVARSLGLDCGPMSGFKAAAVDEEFFAGTRWRTNFICNIGYGTDENLFPRSPRLSFDEACKIV